MLFICLNNFNIDIMTSVIDLFFNYLHLKIVFDENVKLNSKIIGGV